MPIGKAWGNTYSGYAVIAILGALNDVALFVDVFPKGLKRLGYLLPLGNPNTTLLPLLYSVSGCIS